MDEFRISRDDAKEIANEYLATSGISKSIEVDSFYLDRFA